MRRAASEQPRLARYRNRGVRTVLTVGLCLHLFAAYSAAGSVLEQRTHQALGLVAGDVVSLSVDRTPGATQEIDVPLGNTVVTLSVSPHSVRSPQHYQVLHQLADGSYVTVHPGPVRTVRGKVRGIAGSVVAGAVMDDGLTAVIDLPDGERYWIEPIVSLVEGAADGDHIIYRDADVIPGGGSCATTATELTVPDDPPQEGSGCGVLPCVAELGCDADFEFFARWGAGAESRINLVVNTMNIQYERDVGITHQITGIIIRTNPGVPYTGNSTGTLLSQLRADWNANHTDILRDVVQLFTGKSLVGPAIGEAQGIGLVCLTTLAYSVVESDFNNNFASTTDLSAHELGHLWAAFHCNCLTWTMFFQLQSANRFNPSLTVPSIVIHRNSRTCLSDSVVQATAFPLEDNFNSGVFDDSVWIADGPEINDGGDGEPSPPTSVNFNNTDVLTTLAMDASGGCDATVNYWWQRTGTGGSPEPGEDLIVEFRTADGFWLEVARHPGEGADDLPYQFNSIALPGNALHAALQVRWRLLNGESGDFFFIDDVRIGCPNTDPPEIVHASGLPGETRPFSGYIDPRVESSNGVALDRGLSEIAIVFSKPVQHVGGGPLAPDSFSITETGGGSAPAVLSVNAEAMPLVAVTLDRPITLSEYTTVRAIVEDQSDPPQMIVNNGDQGPAVDEPDRVDLAFLPGDVDQSGDVTPFDLLAFRQIVNDVVNPSAGIDGDFVDIDRDNVVAPFDLLIFRQLINGTGPATRAWSGASLNHLRP